MIFKIKLTGHILALIFILLYSEIYAQNIIVTGSWFLTIDTSYLQSGAGSDLTNPFESASAEIEIENKILNKKYWRVDVKKMDNNWHSNFNLYIRRTTDGTGKGWISGGTNYQEITDVDQSYFNGYSNRRNIGNQLKLDNVSVQIPSDTYTTTVYYTVIQTG